MYLQPIKNTVYVCRDGSTADVTYGWEVSDELILNQTGHNWVWYTRFAHRDASVANPYWQRHAHADVLVNPTPS